MKTTMFTVLCRNPHSHWLSTEAFLYVIGQSNRMYTTTRYLQYFLGPGFES